MEWLQRSRCGEGSGLGQILAALCQRLGLETQLLLLLDGVQGMAPDRGQLIPEGPED